MPNPARTLAIAGLLLAPLAVPVITPGAASAATDGTRSSSPRSTAAAATPARRTPATSSSSTTRPTPRSTSTACRCSTAPPPARARGVTALTGTVPGKRVLPRRPGAPAPTASALPTPDAGRHVNMAATAGTVFLAHQPPRCRHRRPAGHRQRRGRRPGRLRHRDHLRDGAPPRRGTTTSVAARRDRRRHRQQRRRLHRRPRHRRRTPRTGPPPPPGDPVDRRRSSEIQGTGATSPFAGSR